jgi:hypothetical protein
MTDQRTWETAMGMRGYAGSPAEREDRMESKRPIQKRKIVEVFEPGYNSRTRIGIMKYVVLECGHMDKTNAGARQRGWVYCFDCYYGKPQHPQALIVLEEKAK